MKKRVWAILTLALLFGGIKVFGQTPKPRPVEMNDDLWARLINRASIDDSKMVGYIKANFAKMFEIGDGSRSIRSHEGNFTFGNRRYTFNLVVDGNIDAIVLLLDVDGRGTFCITDRSRKLRAAGIGDKDGVRRTTIDQSVKDTFKDILGVLAQVALKLPPADKQVTKASPAPTVPRP